MFADFAYLPYPGDGTASDSYEIVLVSDDIPELMAGKDSCFIREPHIYLPRSDRRRYSTNPFRMPVSKSCQGNCIEDQPLQGMQTVAMASMNAQISRVCSSP
jgi:hypothetical protein